MGYTVERIMQGLSDYADAEVMRKLPTSGKWVMGTVISIANQKAHSLVDQLRDNPVVNMLGIIDENDYIDAEALFTALGNSAEKFGDITLDVPLVGRLTFTKNDVENAKRYII